MGDLHGESARRSVVSRQWRSHKAFLLRNDDIVLLYGCPFAVLTAVPEFLYHGTSDEDHRVSIIFKTESPSSHHSNQISRSVRLELVPRRDEGRYRRDMRSNRVVANQNKNVGDARQGLLDAGNLAGTSKLCGKREPHI